MWLLLGILIGATAYQDPYNRFSLSLPEGWEHMRASADETTNAATVVPVSFRRQDDGLLAQALVQIVDGDSEASLEEVAKRSAKALGRIPGYRLLVEGNGKLGAAPAFRRRYVTSFGDRDERHKMSEDRWAVIGGRLYLVHVESLAESFEDFARDFDTLFVSFVAMSGDALALIESPLVGRWLLAGDKDSTLVLRADGTFAFTSFKGTYSVQGELLLLRPFEAPPERFIWQRQEDELTLRADAPGEEPIMYKRDRRAQP